MKPIKCILGMHEYKLEDVEVYYQGEWEHRWHYRAVSYCCRCGKQRNEFFDTPAIGERNVNVDVHIGHGSRWYTGHDYDRVINSCKRKR